MRPLGRVPMPLRGWQWPGLAAWLWATRSGTEAGFPGHHFVLLPSGEMGRGTWPPGLSQVPLCDFRRRDLRVPVCQHSQRELRARGRGPRRVGREPVEGRAVMPPPSRGGLVVTASREAQGQTSGAGFALENSGCPADTLSSRATAQGRGTACSPGGSAEGPALEQLVWGTGDAVTAHFRGSGGPTRPASPCFMSGVREGESFGL